MITTHGRLYNAARQAGLQAGIAGNLTTPRPLTYAEAVTIVTSDYRAHHACLWPGRVGYRVHLAWPSLRVAWLLGYRHGMAVRDHQRTQLHAIGA